MRSRSGRRLGDRVYRRYPCSLCGREISGNGLAQASHKRRHVREGLLTEWLSVDPFDQFRLTDEGRKVVEERKRYD